MKIILILAGISCILIAFYKLFFILNDASISRNEAPSYGYSDLDSSHLKKNYGTPESDNQYDFEYDLNSPDSVDSDCNIVND